MKDLKNQKNNLKSVEKPRIATVFPSEIENGKKMTLTIPNRGYGFTVVMSHESLSVLRQWAIANNYKLDESRLAKPVKPAYRPTDEDEYSYS